MVNCVNPEKLTNWRCYYICTKFLFYLYLRKINKGGLLLTNQELFNEHVSRVNRGKKRSIGGILSLNEQITGRVLYMKQYEITKFILKANANGMSINYSSAYTGNVPNVTSIGVNNSEVICFALTYGDVDNAGVSLKVNNEYYSFIPNVPGYLLLYFDALIPKITSTQEYTVISFVVFVNHQVSNKEVFYFETENSTLAQMFFEFASHYMEGNNG